MIKTILVALDGSEHAEAALQHALWLAERLQGDRHRPPRDRHRVDRRVVPPRHLRFARLRALPRLLGQDARRAPRARARPARDLRAPLRRRVGAVRDRARHGDRRQRDLRSGADGRPRRHRAPRRERAVLDRPPRLDHRVRDPQVAEAGLRHPHALPRDHAPAARLRRLAARERGDARRGRADERARAAAHRACTSRATTRPTAPRSSRRPAATSSRTSSRSPARRSTGPRPAHRATSSRERGHDLLFIGAYGHSRIIEMVLGSTTEYVLRNSPCPVFLAR